MGGRRWWPWGWSPVVGRPRCLATPRGAFSSAAKTKRCELGSTAPRAPRKQRSMRTSRAGVLAVMLFSACAASPDLPPEQRGRHAVGRSAGDQAAMRARLLIDRGEPREALALLEQVLAEVPEHVDARRLRQDVLRERGRRGLLRGRGRTSGSGGSRTTPSRTTCAAASCWTASRSCRCFERSVALAPDSVWPWLGLAHTLRDDDPERALRVYERLFQASGRHPLVGIAWRPRCASSVSSPARGASTAAARRPAQCRHRHARSGPGGAPARTDVPKRGSAARLVAGAAVRRRGARRWRSAGSKRGGARPGRGSCSTCCARTRRGGASSRMATGGWCSPCCCSAAAGPSRRCRRSRHRRRGRRRRPCDGWSAGCCWRTATSPGSCRSCARLRAAARRRRPNATRCAAAGFASSTGPWCAGRLAGGEAGATELLAALRDAGLLVEAELLAECWLRRWPGRIPSCRRCATRCAASSRSKPDCAGCSTAVTRTTTRPSLAVVVPGARGVAARVRPRRGRRTGRVPRRRWSARCSIRSPGLAAHLARYNRHLVLGRRAGGTAEGLLMTRLSCRNCPRRRGCACRALPRGRRLRSRDHLARRRARRATSPGWRC
jgi:hypothetical protein